MVNMFPSKQYQLQQALTEITLLRKQNETLEEQNKVLAQLKTKENMKKKIIVVHSTQMMKKNQSPEKRMGLCLN